MIYWVRLRWSAFSKIPTSRSSLTDMLVWRYEATGEYIVKSGYKALLTNSIQPAYQVPTILGNNYKHFYNSLWNLQALGKIKIHAWRLFNDFLPHYSNLAKKRLIADATCPFYKDSLEDAIHLSCDYRMLE